MRAAPALQPALTTDHSRTLLDTNKQCRYDMAFMCVRRVDDRRLGLQKNITAAKSRAQPFIKKPGMTTRCLMRIFSKHLHDLKWKHILYKAKIAYLSKTLRPAVSPARL